MGIKQMQGTSAYLEYIGPKGRKRKKNCIYNKNNICYYTKAQTYSGSCVGRVYCGNYDDSNNEDISLDKYKKDIKPQNKCKKNNNKKKSRNAKKHLSQKDLLYKEVMLLDKETKETIYIKIVEDKDKDVLSDKISIKSPLGQALCKTNIGREFEVIQGKNITIYVLKDVF
ncbi:GreA/GreB family elongation factor [Clostridium botulinum]|nr:GreA/GreB family elongation factor [Clostridium botulinum]NFL59900.1 GreA/GreB family elongation factor [Clostridium botulinum]NFL63303.1 GreA/GreB family elongation factor [Clostridium botulinum]NFO67801.1 GreA/GreB family elongation factor [Clostridium botulinum]